VSTQPRQGRLRGVIDGAKATADHGETKALLAAVFAIFAVLDSGAAAPLARSAVFGEPASSKNHHTKARPIIRTLSTD